MVTAKETGPAHHPIISEAPQTEQDSFARFIDGNRELFQRHAELTYDLRDEEKGWRKSLTLEKLVEVGMDLGFSLKPSAQISNKEIRRARERIRDDVAGRVFGSQEESNVLSKADTFRGFAMGGKMNPRSRELEKQLTEGVAEARQAFHKARGPIAEEVKESRGELYHKLKEFLLSHPSNIFNFRDFLADKRQGQEREAIKPFLISLAQSETRAAKEGKPSILEEAVKKGTEELVQNPSSIVIDEFSLSIKSPKILGWLGFAADHAGKSPQLAEDSIGDWIQRISAFLKTIDFKLAPPELRGELAAFVSAKYTTALGEIRKELGNFNTSLSLKTLARSHISWPGKGSIEKKHPPVNDSATGEDNNGTKEAEKRKKYPIGVLRREPGKSFEVRIMTDSELADMIKEKAGVLGSRDLRMFEDLKRIVVSLREDPYGFGTKILSQMFVGVENKKLRIRSIDPGKRIGLSLEHPESAQIRIAYVIYRNEGASVIGIEGIRNHKDYDSKFK